MIDKEIPEGFESIGKVYVVEYDNGEMYEDAFHHTDKIFNTRDAAQNYLIDMGLFGDADSMEESQIWREPKYVCDMNNINCDDCPMFHEDEDNFGCTEYEDRMESEWDNSFYTIHEYDLLADYV